MQQQRQQRQQQQQQQQQQVMDAVMAWLSLSSPRAASRQAQARQGCGAASLELLPANLLPCSTPPLQIRAYLLRKLGSGPAGEVLERLVGEACMPLPDFGDRLRK